jgi:hypothetical protein
MLDYKCNPCTFKEGNCPVNCFEANKRAGKVSSEKEYEALKKSDVKFKELNQIWGGSFLE